MLYALIAFDNPYKPFLIRFVWSDNTFSDYAYTEDLYDLCYMLLDHANFLYRYYIGQSDYCEQHYINPQYLNDRRVVENLRI